MRKEGAEGKNALKEPLLSWDPRFLLAAKSPEGSLQSEVSWCPDGFVRYNMN